MSLVGKFVGELACQQNSYLWDLQTTVVSCTETLISNTDTKRAKKNKEKEQNNQSKIPRADGVEDGKVWEIECEDSVLFPEGLNFPNQTSSNLFSYYSTEFLQVGASPQITVRCAHWNSQTTLFLLPPSSARVSAQSSSSHVRSHLEQS